MSTATTVVAPAERSQYLDGHLAEPAGPDHHRGRARPQQVERPLDGVVAGERGVAERSGLAGIEVAQRNQEARRRDEQVVGHAAVWPPARLLLSLPGVLAVVLPPDAAVHAQPAAPRAVDDHRVALREPGRAWPQLLDPARVLMAEREAGRGRPRLRGRLQDMQVGVAGAGAPDLDQDLRRARARAPAPRGARPASALRRTGMLAWFVPSISVS